MRRDFGRVVASSPTAEAPRLLNAELGSSRDVNVCDDGAKPRSHARWARVLELKSSLRMAIQIAVELQYLTSGRFADFQNGLCGVSFVRADIV